MENNDALDIGAVSSPYPSQSEGTISKISGPFTSLHCYAFPFCLEKAWCYKIFSIFTVTWWYVD